MRIFYASDATPNGLLAGNKGWYNNLYLPLVDLGHDVVPFDFDLRETFRHLDPAQPGAAAFIAANRPRVTDALLNQIKAAHAEKPIDLLFTYFYDACVFPEAIDAIKALGIVTVNWFCNASYQLHLVSEISPRYDWCLVAEKFRLQDYEALGARPLYCQEAANPAIYKPYDLPVIYDATFVGMAYGDRPAYIHSLLKRGIQARAWGPNWQELAAPDPARRLWRLGRRMVGLPTTTFPALPRAVLGPGLVDTEMIKIYSQSKINLGFSTCGETHKSGERIVQVRLRDFEVPMSGGFYLVEYMEELEEFYEIGKEIVCYDGPDDLADKVQFYLAHDGEREQIRQAGRARCLRDHTWQKRFQASFAQMGLA